MAYTTIKKPSDYFNTKLYTGNGTDATGITGVGFQPDWVWIKNRQTAQAPRVFDVVRGATKLLYPSETDAEGTSSTQLTSFDSDGFTVGTSSAVNGNGNGIVSWNWKKTATAGFDIVAYTGTGSSNAVSHSLSATPSMIIIKNRDDIDSWYVWHQGLGAVASNYINLNTSGAKSSVSDGITAISSSNFTVNTRGDVNASSEKYIAYCFADVQGFSKFGSYVGNSSADGAFIYTGFSPSFVIIKNIDAAESWSMFDGKRPDSNQTNGRYQLQPNTSSGEYQGAPLIDFVSNGFKLRTATNSLNVAQNYIYMCFAEEPLVGDNPATAR